MSKLVDDAVRLQGRAEAMRGRYTAAMEAARALVGPAGTEADYQALVALVEEQILFLQSDLDAIREECSDLKVELETLLQEVEALGGR